MSGTKYFIPAAAIGGGSSCKSSGNESTTINISGGYVYAQSLGGAAIGGGSSTMSSGGAATINISGSAVVEAQSVSGTATNGASVAHGVSIGGGTAGAAGKSNGGSITLNVSGGSLYTGSIGGGGCANNSGSIGSGTVTINGGSIRGQIVMGAGSVSKNIFNMTGGSIDNNPENNKNGFSFLEPNGGAVYLEYGDAIIEGGTIKNCTSDNGGAVYVVGGNFKMLGGKITNCSSVYGGAVHVNGGSFEIIDGEMSQNSSTNGGAVYVNGGNLTVNGGLFKNNSATDGGAAYIKGGNVNMYNGTFDSNSAINNGGAIYVNTSSVDVTINIFDGQIINNTSENHGGAIGANAVGDYSIVLNIGDQDCLGTETHNHEDNTCPEISNNTTSDLGGAFCLHGSKSGLALNIYCGDVAGNIAIRNEGSNSINQGGGSVTVYGGHIDPGIMVGGGIYIDNRIDAQSVFVRFWGNYDGAPTEPIIIEVTDGITLNFPADIYVNGVHELSGWTHQVNSQDGWVPVGGLYAVDGSKGTYIDYYAVWDAVVDYIVYIPETCYINEDGFGSMEIKANLSYFKKNSNLDVFANSEFVLTNILNPNDFVEFTMTTTEPNSSGMLDDGDLIASWQYNNTNSRILTLDVFDKFTSGVFTGIITFAVEYSEID